MAWTSMAFHHSGAIELMRQVLNYIASNGYCTITDIKENDKTQAAQLIRAFGNKDTANEALSSLSQFIIYRKNSITWQRIYQRNRL